MRVLGLQKWGRVASSREDAQAGRQASKAPDICFYDILQATPCDGGCIDTMNDLGSISTRKLEVESCNNRPSTFRLFSPIAGPARIDSGYRMRVIPSTSPTRTLGVELDN